MTPEITNVKPKLGTFLGLFTLALIPLFIFKIILQISIYENLVELNSFLWWFNLILFPFVFSVGVIFGARRIQLNIADTDDIEKMKKSTLLYFSNNGLRISESNVSDTTLESNKGFYRLFNNWFGTELVHVRQIENKLIVEGPLRHVDSFDSKLRFGKPLN